MRSAGDAVRDNGALSGEDERSVRLDGGEGRRADRGVEAPTAGPGKGERSRAGLLLAADVALRFFDALREGVCGSAAPVERDLPFGAALALGLSFDGPASGSADDLRRARVEAVEDGKPAGAGFGVPTCCEEEEDDTGVSSGLGKPSESAPSRSTVRCFFGDAGGELSSEDGAAVSELDLWRLGGIGSVVVSGSESDREMLGWRNGRDGWMDAFCPAGQQT